MKKTMKTLLSWLRDRAEAAKSRRKAKESRRLEMASEKAVQLMEYGGELYVSHNGEPVLPLDGLKWDLATTLTSMRGAWVSWQERERHGSY